MIKMTKEEALAFLKSIENKKLTKEEEQQARIALAIVSGGWGQYGG